MAPQGVESWENRRTFCSVHVDSEIKIVTLETGKCFMYVGN